MNKAALNKAISAKLAAAQHKLGVISLSKSDITKAKACFEAAIRVMPDHFSAHLELSRLKQYTQTDPHLSVLEGFTDAIADYPESQQIEFWFALGKAREDCGEFDSAFSAYRHGNELKRSSFEFDIQARQQTVEAITQQFSKAFAEQGLGYNESPAPVFIVGMPRSGSTLIEQILASHSQVAAIGESTELQEIISRHSEQANNNYIHWLATAPEQQIKNCAAEYLEFLNTKAPNALRVVNKLPGNFYYVGLIYKLFPNAKVIYSTREPLDICISNYAQLFAGNTHFAYDLKELAQYCRLCETLMSHWQRILPEGFILNLKYENLVSDFETHAKQLIDFCGLNWQPECLNFHQNKRVINTASQAQVNRPVYTSSVNRWRRFERVMGDVRGEMLVTS
ncbi:tetratricopeptide repeat-containing sulfotransferase family protein [Reinekea marinisedimentorum]|uniref:Tetratricopeptide repeat protein n=1 Tax=Reinekea marinisedimentorum TaxID=230495 RepID=A0A4V6NY42_9GAMM|nr:sulfotransferase [Reinekea marinisedimentorum]TCS42109.1 tetratricopeptide repeat protein [Reinekea marinisedimentorum]